MISMYQSVSYTTVFLKWSSEGHLQLLIHENHLSHQISWNAPIRFWFQVFRARNLQCCVISSRLKNQIVWRTFKLCKAQSINTITMTQWHLLRQVPQPLCYLYLVALKSSTDWAPMIVYVHPSGCNFLGLTRPKVSPIFLTRLHETRIL